MLNALFQTEHMDKDLARVRNEDVPVSVCAFDDAGVTGVNARVSGFAVSASVQPRHAVVGTLTRG